MTRRGAGNVSDRQLRAKPGTASRAWRAAVDERLRERGEPTTEWVEDDIQPEQPPRPKKSARSKKSAAERLPADVLTDLTEAAGQRRAKRMHEQLADAAKAYERDRYRDAAAILKPLADIAPRAAAVRELYGLTLYRLGRWSAAIKQLEAFHDLTSSYDQHPTLADCYRALKRYRRVEEVWSDLKSSSPTAELAAEGRLVLAGAHADRGDINRAVEVLEQAPGARKKGQKRPRDHQLRVWYALGDLYERAGDIPRARELFRRVADHDPDLYDVTQRLRGLA